MKKYYILFCIIITIITARHCLAKGITIIDDTGQKITLASPATRIVTLYGAVTQTVCALQFCDRLVGVTKRDNWPEECRKKTKVGTHMRPNLEIIIGLKPDIVLQGSIRPGSQQVIKKLKALGIKVAIFNPTNFEELFYEMKRIAILCGDIKKAKELITTIKKQLKGIKEKYPLSIRPGIIFEISYPSLLVAGQKNFVTDIILKAGGTNLININKKIVKINLESLIAKNPDLYIIQKGPMNKLSTDPKKRANFTAISAIKEGKFLIVDEFLFSRPTPLAINAVKLLRKYLYGLYPAH